jgi:hypothetical protein
MGRERDGGCGKFAAGLAFPVVADFAALDKLGHDRSDHPIAAIGATDRRCKGANTSGLAGALKFCNKSLRYRAA